MQSCDYIPLHANRIPRDDLLFYVRDCRSVNGLALAAISGLHLASLLALLCPCTRCPAEIDFVQGTFSWNCVSNNFNDIPLAKGDYNTASF